MGCFEGDQMSSGLDLGWQTSFLSGPVIQFWLPRVLHEKDSKTEQEREP